ncbi:MarR family winged helix-turn-helix transcriptional regulator [Marinicauda algicola]|nr:MarR family winged helix-turn-helix transcriptional regulator [Marinicauda algicola]
MTDDSQDAPAPGGLIEAARAVRSDPGARLRRLARAWERSLDAAIAPSGLTSAQFTLMALVAGARDDRIGAIAQQAGLDPSTLSRTLAGLERAGLLEITTVERDRRRRAAWLTETGLRWLAQALPLWREAHRDWEQETPEIDMLLDRLTPGPD